MSNGLKPVVDEFRNYIDDPFVKIAPDVAPEEIFLDSARLLTLTAPDWVALVGGLRVMAANHDGSASGVLTDRVGVLSNDCFRVLTSVDHEWKKLDDKAMAFSIVDRATGEQRFEATRCDLVFGSNSQLRAVAEVYAGSDGHARFVKDFVKVWDKVMMLDRYDARQSAWLKAQQRRTWNHLASEPDTHRSRARAQQTSERLRRRPLNGSGPTPVRASRFSRFLMPPSTLRSA
ncbi:MAG: hypothetical protein H0W48_07600 [Methylibium sp.]|nr:hypothetical protein [Methylibium sp.]